MQSTTNQHYQKGPSWVPPIYDDRAAGKSADTLRRELPLTDILGSGANESSDQEVIVYRGRIIWPVDRRASLSTFTLLLALNYTAVVEYHVRGRNPHNPRGRGGGRE